MTTDLTRAEQEAGAARIRRWGRDHINDVVKLPASERDIVILAAGLWDMEPAVVDERHVRIIEIP